MRSILLKLVLFLSLLTLLLCVYLRDVSVKKLESGSTTLTPLFRKVTKSLSELNRSKQLNDHVLIVNRIPGSGAELIVFLLESLQGMNNYKHIRLKGASKSFLNSEQQRQYVNSVIDMMKEHPVPLSFDKVVRFTNFSQYGQQPPTHINIVRDPIDKLTSDLNRRATSTAFYDMKPMKNMLIEKIARKIINACKHAVNSIDCFKSNGIFNDLSIPYFCGHEPECLKYNSIWALNKAKTNVEIFYPVVGLLEHINYTLEAFEDKLPYFFRNVQNVYFQKFRGTNSNHNSSNILSKSDYASIKKLFSNEYDFYCWLKKRLFDSVGRF